MLQIRKIYASLNDLAASSDVTMEAIKAKILPLLKGNPILADWFVALFPTEKPGEPTPSDYETVNVEKNQQSDDITDNLESFEKIPASELFPDTENTSGCGIKYLQGRIFYGNRILLPAKLSFLAYEMFPPPPLINSGELIPQSGENETNCVHNIRNLIENAPNPISEDVNLSLSSSEEPEDHKTGLSSIKPQLLPFSPLSDDASYEICDDTALRMHAIRINPIVHTNRSFGDAGDGHHHKDELSDASLKNSPRRNAKKPISPQTKKSTMKSPPMVEIPRSMIEIPLASPALVTAKRLRTLVEEDLVPTSEDERPLSERIKEGGGQNRLKNKRSRVVQAVADESESELNKSIGIAKKRRRKGNKKEENVSKKVATPVESWTRDEDKLILEVIECGVTDECELVGNVQGQLERRTHREIVERYGFLMEVMKQFQINTAD